MTQGEQTLETLRAVLPQDVVVIHIDDGSSHKTVSVSPQLLATLAFNPNRCVIRIQRRISLISVRELVKKETDIQDFIKVGMPISMLTYLATQDVTADPMGMFYIIDFTFVVPSVEILVKEIVKEAYKAYTAVFDKEVEDTLSTKVE